MRLGRGALITYDCGKMHCWAQERRRPPRSRMVWLFMVIP